MNSDTALYIPHMRPDRGIGHDGDYGGSIDGKEKIRGRPEAASGPLKIKIPKGNEKCVTDLSGTTTVVMFWSTVIVKGVMSHAAVGRIWNKGHGGNGQRVDQGRVTPSILVELRRSARLQPQLLWIGSAVHMAHGE